jgi:hypothetical protein
MSTCRRKRCANPATRWSSTSSSERDVCEKHFWSHINLIAARSAFVSGALVGAAFAVTRLIVEAVTR